MKFALTAVIAACFLSISGAVFCRERTVIPSTSGNVIGNPVPTTVIPGLGQLGANETFRDVRNVPLRPFRPFHHRVCVNGVLKDHGRWWWFHQSTGRWLFWNGRNWCWRDAFNGGALFYYVGGEYYPVYDEGEMAPPAPEAAVPAASAEPGPPLPVSESETMVDAQRPPADVPVFYYSSDGSRMVQVSGADHEAKLYDSTIGGSPVFIGELTPGVQNVKISGTLAARSLQISVYLESGSVERFEADGEVLR